MITIPDAAAAQNGTHGTGDEDFVMVALRAFA